MTKMHSMSTNYTSITKNNNNNNNSFQTLEKDTEK